MIRIVITILPLTQQSFYNLIDVVDLSYIPGKLSQIMFANQDKVKSIRKLTESFDEESGEYPLIQVHFFFFHFLFFQSLLIAAR